MRKERLIFFRYFCCVYNNYVCGAIKCFSDCSMEMNEAKSNVEFTNPYKTFVLEKRIKRERRIHTRAISNFVRRRVRTEDLKSLKLVVLRVLYFS